jgi:DNA mismatch repair protein MutL
MNRIRVLPENLANQIAAGEVVERPASVVKELVENAIDAEATRIRVETELGGRRLIRVSDDGTGMGRDDAVLAFERHATSKIRELGDLARIITLGFRGEALASIASVAKVEMLTSTGDPIGTRVAVEGGRLIDVSDGARSRGTTIAVRDLFFNTPARRKFMRAEATENYHLASIVTHYALAHPEIGFTLASNGREIVAAQPAKDLTERAFQLFGGGLIESLLQVDGGRDQVARITGFISAPRMRRTTRDGQYFFVNQRYVRDKTIAGGLLEGYRSVLPHGVYPVAFLFLDVPVEEIDVNVHPAKTEIRFRRTEAVKDAIAEAIRSTLAGAGIIQERESEETVVDEPDSIPPALEQAEITFSPPVDAQPVVLPTAPVADVGSAAASMAVTGPSAAEPAIEPQPTAPQTILKPAPDIERTPSAGSTSPSLDLPPVDSAERFLKPADAGAVAAGRIKAISQLHDSFIIAVDDRGMLLIDQHVAHERILFDKYRERESGREIESQNLLLPETIDLTPAESEAFHLVADELTSVGFGIMRLSGRTIAIKSVPTDLPPAAARNVLGEILESVAGTSRSGAKKTLRDHVAADLACKAAVKINMPLSHEKMQWLIDNLLLTSSPTTCPHGRPIVLRLTMKDIERGFHRS